MDNKRNKEPGDGHQPAPPSMRPEQDDADRERTAREQVERERQRAQNERAAPEQVDREGQERDLRARERVFTERMDRDRRERERLEREVMERGAIARENVREVRREAGSAAPARDELLASDVHRDPAPAEPLYRDPVHAEPVRQEAMRREPVRNEPLRQEPRIDDVRRDDDIQRVSRSDVPAGVQQSLYDAERSQGRRRLFGILVLVALAAAAYWGWLEWQKRQGTAEPVAVAPAPGKQEAQPAGPPPIQHPIAPTSEPLPALADSDAAVTKALGDLVGAGRLADVFVPGNVVRKIVASVDNAGRQQLYTRNTPLKSPPSSFMVSGTGDARTINPRNSARYAIYAQVVEQVDAQKFGVAYQRYYPLFQQAYEELGYPGRYFNDRLVEVIDLLLATPDAPAAPTLVQPKVNFEYADPRLESLTAGQKALIRMGPTESARVKAKLREIRSAITAQPAQAPSASAEKGG
jgi:hypothetical protein